MGRKAVGQLVWLKHWFFQDSVFYFKFFLLDCLNSFTQEKPLRLEQTHAHGAQGTLLRTDPLHLLYERLVRKALFTKELNRLIHQIGKHSKRAWLMP